jgi:5,10-methylenetetrahydrofolate reductase
MSLHEVLESGKFAVTAQIDPAKGVDITEFLHNAELLRGRVHAVTVSDQQSAVMRLGSLAGCCLLRQKGIEPVLHMTCRDRNRIALQSDLLNAYVLGIENILCLTGDDINSGDHRQQAKPVFDLGDSVVLLQAARTLEQGKDLAGRELKGAPHFFLGACVTPGAEPLEPEIMKMEKKVKAGAQFFQTQAIFEPEKFETFMQQAKKFGVPVLGGIMLLRSAAMARFMNRNIAGIHVPVELIDEIDDAEDKEQKSIEIAARLLNQMRGMCQGIHIMAIGLERNVPAVLAAAGF